MGIRAEKKESESKGEKGRADRSSGHAESRSRLSLELMRRNVHGTVTLYAVIRNDGSVTDMRVLNGVDDNLTNLRELHLPIGAFVRPQRMAARWISKRW